MSLPKKQRHFAVNGMGIKPQPFVFLLSVRRGEGGGEAGSHDQIVHLLGVDDLLQRLDPIRFGVFRLHSHHVHVRLSGEAVSAFHVQAVGVGHQIFKGGVVPLMTA